MSEPITKNPMSMDPRGNDGAGMVVVHLEAPIQTAPAEQPQDAPVADADTPDTDGAKPADDQTTTGAGTSNHRLGAADTPTRPERAATGAQDGAAGKP